MIFRYRRELVALDNVRKEYPVAYLVERLAQEGESLGGGAKDSIKTVLVG